MRIASKFVLIATAIIFVAEAAHAQWVWTPQTGRWVNLKRVPKESPELQVEYARSLMLEGRHKRALDETEKFNKFYSDTEFADDNQYLRGEIRMNMGNHKGAAKEFQQLVKSYPSTELYTQAIQKQYEIGDHFYEAGQKKRERKWALMKNRPLRRATEVYAMVIENQPFSPEAAQAQYKIGLCHHARKDYTEAAFEYRRVIEDYAGSEWVDDAGYGLAMCYVDGSLPPDYDQSRAKLAVRAIDDFKNQYPGDSRAAELDGKRQAMRDKLAESQLRTARFYVKRREFLSARIYFESLVKDFADTPAAAAAQQWLDSNPGAPTLRARPGTMAAAQ